MGRGGRSSVTTVAKGVDTSNGSDDARAGSDFANTVVEGVSDVDIERRINRDARGVTQLSQCGKSTVTIVAIVAITSNSTDDTSTGSDFANDVIIGVRDIDIISGIDRYT